MMPCPGGPSAGDLGPRLFHQIPGFDLTRNFRNLEEMVCASKQHASCFAGKISIDIAWVTSERSGPKERN